MTTNLISAPRSDGATILERLARVDTCAVSYAMDSLGHAGSVSALRPVGAQQSLFGIVRTIRLAAVPRQETEDHAHLGTRVLESCSGGEVIVIEQTANTKGAAWGGLLSVAAKGKQVRGVVTNGLVRDLEEVKELDFPVYARGATPITARGRIFEAAVDIPVMIEGVAVEVGDYVIADSSGVVFLPARDVHRVLEAAELILREEKAMRTGLSSGESPSRVLGNRYEWLLRQ